MNEAAIMVRATGVRVAGASSSASVDCVVLDHDERRRRRIAMKGVRGTRFLLDLPQAVALRGGDLLELDDGRLVEVVAAAEQLAEVRAPHARDLARLAWHLGNRHLETQIVSEKKLRIRRDPVIEDMLRRLGASVIEIQAPFEPEGGAYGDDSAGAVHGREHESRHA